MAIFTAVTVQYGLPSDLLPALCYVESKHRVNAIHRNDGQGHSIGVCQIKLKTAKHMGFKGTEQQLLNPKTNIKYAALYLKHQIKRYNGQVNKGVIAYNQGHAGSLVTTKYQMQVFNEWRK